MEKREAFGSRIAVIMAMAGSAIGLGNIWRFPYMAGEHGGSAFVIVYIIATLFVSLPVFIAEVIIGRRSRCNAFQAMGRLAPGQAFWKKAGFLAVLIPTIIASYYSVIGGWSVGFFVQSLVEPFARVSPERASSLFGSFSADPWWPVVLHLVFLGLCCLVVAGGVRSGIEKFSKYTLPVLFVLILAMIVYSVSLPGARAGVEYLLKPDFSEMTPRTFAYALGQSFYSLSLGMGSIITYGSYVRKDENILASGMGTAVSDLGFALLAGLAIMPAVFAAGIEPGVGPGLIFQSIPYIFSTMGSAMPLVSVLISAVFFFAVIIAAMTSCISLIEVGVAWMVERFGMKRPQASLLLLVVCGGLGVLCSLSFGPLSGMTLGGMTLFDIFDSVSSNILLLIMAFLSVFFVGFVMNKQDVRDEFTNGGTLRSSGKVFGLLYFLIKWVAPIAVVLIFVTNFIL